MELNDLWKAHLTIRGGGNEYGEDIFIRGATTLDEAVKEAGDYAKHYWEEDEEAEESTLCPGWYEEPCGYRLIRRDSVEQVKTLEDLFRTLVVIQPDGAKVEHYKTYGERDLIPCPACGSEDLNCEESPEHAKCNACGQEMDTGIVLVWKA